jgi:hypothetical protein
MVPPVFAFNHDRVSAFAGQAKITHGIAMQACTGRYRSAGDDDRCYVVEVWTTFAVPGSLPDAGVEPPLQQTLQTSAGEKVEYLSKGQYQLVGTGVRLRSDAPDAP